MIEETRPPLDLNSEVSPQENPTPPGPIPVAERPARVARRRREAPELPSPKADRPRLFSASVFYALGALLTALTWLAHLNPRSPVLGERTLWPWQLFRSNFAAGGEPTFAWSFAHAVALVLAVVILYYLIAAILRTSHARGAVALLVTLVPITLFWSTTRTPLAYTAGLVAAVAGGAVILRHDGRRLARGVLFVAGLVLGGMLVFPTLEGAELGYRPQILTLVEPFLDFVRGDIPLRGDRLVSGDGLHALLLLALAVLGLLAAVGVRRRWVKIAAGLVLLLAIVLPPLATRAFGLDDTRPEALDLLGILNMSYWVWTLGLTLVLVAALASWLGFGGRWAAWLAGTALLLLVFDQPATMFREAASVPGSVDPVGAGVVAVGQHLALGAFVAFILPVAALVMDLARPRT